MYQPLSQPTRGIGDLEGVPDTRSGGSVLEAPPGAEEGALPRERRPVRHLKQLTHGSLTPPRAASGYAFSNN